MIQLNNMPYTIIFGGQVIVRTRRLHSGISPFTIEKVHTNPAYNPDADNKFEKYSNDLGIAVVVGTFHFVKNSLANIRINLGLMGVLPSNCYSSH